MEDLGHQQQLIDPNMVRDRMRQVPLFTPIVRYPEGIRCDWDTYSNGLRRYEYTYPVNEPVAAKDARGQRPRITINKAKAAAPGQSQIGKSPLVVDFLFPCNWPVLEVSADRLFAGLQSELKMKMTFLPVKSKPLGKLMSS